MKRIKIVVYAISLFILIIRDIETMLVLNFLRVYDMIMNAHLIATVIIIDEDIT